MTINIVGLIVLIILVTLCYYVVEQLVTDLTLKKIFRVVIVVVAVLGLLQVFGLLGGRIVFQ
jgi:hypothetical protein